LVEKVARVFLNQSQSIEKQKQRKRKLLSTLQFKTALIAKGKAMSFVTVISPHFTFANCHCLLAAGTPQDKLRLFIIYFISGPTMSPVRSEQLS